MKDYDELGNVKNREDVYFDSNEEDALHDAYLMLRDRGYDTGDLGPLREIILTETTFGERALDH